MSIKWIGLPILLYIVFSVSSCQTTNPQDWEPILRSWEQKVLSDYYINILRSEQNSLHAEVLARQIEKQQILLQIEHLKERKEELINQITSLHSVKDVK